MPKFRKRPVVIEAVKFDGIGFVGGAPEWLAHALVRGTVWISRSDHQLYVDTLEGGHTASPGDWIIQGVAGELYPCKPDIFAKTYEAVE